MKVAVCLSGIVRGQVPNNLSKMRELFPFDYFYSTYTNRKGDLDWFGIYDNITYFEEPKLHYHCIKDVKELYSFKLKSLKKDIALGRSSQQYLNTVPHHTKQILIHANLLNHIDKSYDMIIRTRFDCFLSNKVDWNYYLEKSYNENIPIGFGTRTSRWKNLDKFKEVPKLYPDGKKDVSQDWAYYIMDPLIMHPRNLFDSEHAFRLHTDKKLLPAEVGWWQVLSEPYGGEHHLSVYGGAQIERFMKQTEVIL